MKAPVLMSQTEQEDYVAFLVRFAGHRRGLLADFLREAAQQLNPWGHRG